MDETAIEALQSLGFSKASTDSPLMPSGFTRADCEAFLRYPQPVPWGDDYVDPADQELFKSMRDTLKRLARWLADRAMGDADFPLMRGEASLYAANGRSQSHIWCCIYPRSVVNKSYALQVALIISAQGAEVCLCLGAGRSTLKGLRLEAAQRDFGDLRARLAMVPPDVVQALEALLPARAVLRASWRDPGDSEFSSIQEWLHHASGPKGAQASISMFLTVDELDRLGPLIENVMLDMARAAGPLFRYCYGVPEASQAKAYALQEESLAQDVEPPAAIMEIVQPPVAAPSAEFDAEALEELARAEHGLELEPGVYRAVVAAIRSGKHVILTGPPGTAKTTLAEMVCQLAGEARWCSGHALTTATSDWTTYETIGGLRPAGSGTSLEFRPGILLEAARDNQWVIIDELNRSNFDRAFGQFFTVLSGQPVVLPYEDPQTRRRILLCPQKAARRNPAEGYEWVLIPEKWRIVATMNVFDKSLLYEMSFALMRRFAFIEVPSPEPAVFELLWNRELKDLQPEQADRIRQTLTGLMALRSVKDIGPAVFIDMARFAAEYLSAGEDLTAGQLAFQLFYSYLLPQYEGITQQQGLDLFSKVHAITGHTERLTRTLTEVLGITLQSEPADDDDNDNDFYPGTGQASVSQS